MLIKREQLFQFKNVTFLLMLIFLVKGIIYAVYLIPPAMGVSPDDTGHFSYIQYIALEKKLPVLNETTISPIAHQSYNDINYKGIFKNIYVDDIYHQTTEKNWIVQHPFLYYLLMVPFYWLANIFTSNFSYILITLRIATILLGVVAIYIIYKILECLKCNFIISCCILFTFVFSAPIQFCYSNVTNDSLLITLCTTALLFLLKYFETKKEYYYYLFVFVCACVVLTKYTGPLVLIGYILFFIYKSIKIDGLHVTIRLILKGGLFGILILFPFFYRNYSLFNNILPTSGSKILTKPVVEVSLFRFLGRGYYFNELYTHICCLIGWVVWVRANMVIKIYVSVILACSAFLYCQRMKSIILKIFIFLFCISGLYIANYLLYFHFSTSLAIASCCAICFGIIFSNQEDKEISLFFLLSVGVLLTVFIIQHYRIYLKKGYTGAMHGRYYYISFFPATFIIFNSMKFIPRKFQNIIPPIYLLGQLSCEYWIMSQYIVTLGK